MQDARRFLRYVIPGLVFVLEVSLYLFVSCRAEFVEFISSWAEAWYAGFPISVFVGSGGIGFLLGVIYHVLYQYPPLSCLAVDHRPLIRDVEKNSG